jgi:serine/threonine protein phosphatase 1
MRRLVDIIGLGRLETERPSIPKDLALFAIGDIHGRLDLLVKMHQEILLRTKDLPPYVRKAIVYLGDYIDYGPDSADVIDTLVSSILPGFKSIYLLGNHELAFLSFLKGEMDFLRWSKTRSEKEELPSDYLISQNLSNWLHEQGGLFTLKSYGLNPSTSPSHKALAEMRVELLRRIPTDHLSFLENLQLSASFGDFFFVHAGVDPQRPLNEQNPSDLLNITDRFLNTPLVLDKIIVHGHTPFQAPCIKSNRIGLDTEAHRSGILSCLTIINDQFSVFSVS